MWSEGGSVEEIERVTNGTVRTHIVYGPEIVQLPV